MKKAAFLWLIVGLLALIVSGIVADHIFEPHPIDFSFRVLSNYAAVVIILIVAVVCWNRNRT
jgi:hypothetical protein